MKVHRSLLRLLPSLACLSLLLLCSCAPPPAGSSAALKQQLSQILEQQRQQAEQLSALQQRLDLIQQGPGQQAISETALPTAEDPSSSLPPVAALLPPKVPASAKQEISALADSASAYLNAFSSLASGRYAQAESGFSQFLSAYPTHQYAANARYWLASSQLSLGNLSAAATNLRQIVIDINGQEKAPAALVLLARVYRQQQQDQEADDILEQLQNRYPESAEAQQFYRSEQTQQ